MFRKPTLLLLIALAVAACGSTPTAVPTAPPADANTGYPGPAAVLVTPSASDPLTGYPALVGSTPVVQPEAPAEAPAPAAGRASISGVVFAYNMAMVLPKTSFYLAPATGPNDKGVPEVLGQPNAARGDIIGQTDEAGRLSLTDIPPGKYYLLVWAPLDYIFGQVSQADETPRLIELTADQALPLGVIYLSWR